MNVIRTNRAIWTKNKNKIKVSHKLAGQVNVIKHDLRQLDHIQQKEKLISILFLFSFYWYTSFTDPLLKGSTYRFKRQNEHICYLLKRKNILNKLLKYSSITRQLFNIFLHEFLMEFRAQGVINEAFLSTRFIHSFSAVFKHDIIVPPAKNRT